MLENRICVLKRHQEQAQKTVNEIKIRAKKMQEINNLKALTTQKIVETFVDNKNDIKLSRKKVPKFKDSIALDNIFNGIIHKKQSKILHSQIVSDKIKQIIQNKQKKAKAQMRNSYPEEIIRRKLENIKIQQFHEAKLDKIELFHRQKHLNELGKIESKLFNELINTKSVKGHDEINYLYSISPAKIKKKLHSNSISYDASPIKIYKY